jgi:hypothetical protein
MFSIKGVKNMEDERYNKAQKVTEEFINSLTDNEKEYAKAYLLWLCKDDIHYENYPNFGMGWDRSQYIRTTLRELTHIKI